MGLLSAIALTLLLVCSSHSTEINVTFELRENDLNEVIFVDDEGIVLLCCVFGASYEYKRIRIGHETREDILTTFATPNCRTYTINKVSLNDGGVYTCNISYLDGNGITRHKTKSLYLNVQDNQTPYCFRNGTPGNHYCVGDVLLMSCYCLAEMPCMWIQNVPDSRFSSIINSYDTGSRSDKMISRILVEVGSVESPTNATYICYHSQLVRQRCSIGPQNESSTDLVINNNAENTPIVCTTDVLKSTPVSTIQSRDSTTPLNTRRSISRKKAGSSTTFALTTISAEAEIDFPVGLIAVLVVICGLVFVIVILIIVIIVLKCRKQERNYMKEKYERNDKDDPIIANHMYINDAYVSIDQDRKETIGGSTDDVIKPKKDDSNIYHMEKGKSNELVDIYAKVDKNRKKSWKEMPETKKMYEDHRSSKQEQDLGTLYAKVHKDAKISGRRKEWKQLVSKDGKTSEDEEDFASLYASVDKGRRNPDCNTRNNIQRGDVDGSEMYAEIGQNA